MPLGLKQHVPRPPRIKGLMAPRLRFRILGRGQRHTPRALLPSLLMPTPSAAAATPGLAFAAAEPPPQAPLPGPCWRSRGARPTCAPLTHTPCRAAQATPHAVWEGSVVATQMRVGAPDDGARAPRPMFTGHAAAIVGVCLRGGQPNIFQTIIARHASAAWGPRRPPHRCGWACRGRSCGRVRTARRPGSAVGALCFRAKTTV